VKLVSNVLRCGYVGIIGRPNVGKSTLLNHVLNYKLSITSNKPQTTRQQIIGVFTENPVQMVFVDTPGIHKGAKKALNKYMNRSALAVLDDVDVLVWLIEALRWTEEEDWILSKLQSIESPVILVVNKIDKIKDKAELLPFLQRVTEKYSFADVIPISARLGKQVHELKAVITKFLPEQPYFYDEKFLTTSKQNFLIAEYIREKLMKLLGQELPYGTTVTIDAFADDGDIIRVAATIWVDRKQHKPMVIGKQGQKLKEIGIAARKELEHYFEKKVFVKLWVKVKENWSDDASSLTQFGFE